MVWLAGSGLILESGRGRGHLRSVEWGVQVAKSLFIVIRRYGPPYDPSLPLEKQVDWGTHRVFMNALESRGLVRLGGPMESGGDVLLVFRAEDQEEIERNLAADPWSQSGLLTTTRIARWNLRIGQVG